MAGFTSERKSGAESLMHANSNPKIIGLVREDVEKMVAEGTPENVLHNKHRAP